MTISTSTLETKSGPELIDLYNGAAASLGEKLVNRFNTKESAVRRTADILKRLEEKREGKAAAPKAPAPAVPAAAPAAKPSVSAGETGSALVNGKAVPLSALEPGCLAGPDPKLVLRKETAKVLAEAAPVVQAKAPKKAASSPSVSNWVRYVSVQDPKYTIRISPKSVERAGAPTDPYGKVMIPATN